MAQIQVMELQSASLVREWSLPAEEWIWGFVARCLAPVAPRKAVVVMMSSKAPRPTFKGR